MYVSAWVKIVTFVHHCINVLHILFQEISCPLTSLINPIQKHPYSLEFRIHNIALYAYITIHNFRFLNCSFFFLSEPDIRINVTIF